MSMSVHKNFLVSITHPKELFFLTALIHMRSASFLVVCSLMAARTLVLVSASRGSYNLESSPKTLQYATLSAYEALTVLPQPKKKKVVHSKLGGRL